MFEDFMNPSPRPVWQIALVLTLALALMTCLGYVKGHMDGRSSIHKRTVRWLLDNYTALRGAGVPLPGWYKHRAEFREENPDLH